MSLPNLALMRLYGTADVFFAKTAAGGSAFASQVAGVEGTPSLGGENSDQRSLAAQQLNEQFRLAVERVGQPANQGIVTQVSSGGGDTPVGWDEGTFETANTARRAGQDMAKRAAAALNPAQTILKSHGMMSPVPKPMASPGTLASPVMDNRAAREKVVGKLQASAPLAAPPVTTTPSPATAAPAATTGKPSLMEGAFGKHWLAKGTLAGGALLGGYGALKLVDKGLGVLGQATGPKNWGEGGQLPMGVNQYGQPQPGSPMM